MPIYESQKRAVKRYHQEHRDELREYLQKWREANPPNKEKNCQYTRDYRLRKKRVKLFEDEVRVLCSIELF